MTTLTPGPLGSRLRTLAGGVVYSHFTYGSNYRLSEWQGAVLGVQLTRLEQQTAHRHRNGRLLDKLLAEIPGITPQKCDPRCTRNGQYAYIFHVDCKHFAGISTGNFIAALNAEGIPTQASFRLCTPWIASATGNIANA